MGKKREEMRKEIDIHYQHVVSSNFLPVVEPMIFQCGNVRGILYFVRLRFVNLFIIKRI